MKLFEKNNKKAVVNMNYNEETIRGSTTTVPLKDGRLIKYLKDKTNKYGEIVITKIENDEIYVTTAPSIKKEKEENRLEEIEQLIRNHIESKVSETDAYLVLAKGKFKGVFGSETHCRLKESNLIKNGFKEEEIEIKPIRIDNYSY